MVQAEDHVWDAYIKVRPDARSYRVKTVPSYHKLCIIYGQDKDGSYSHLLHSIDSVLGDFGNQIQKEEETYDGNTNPIIDWTPSMEHYFVNLMLEQVHHGNKIDYSFDDQAWADMTLSFKKQFGPQYEQHIMENHYLSLMKEYMETSSLLNQDGFLWDETSGTIIAEKNLWELYAKEHPEAISYKDIPINYYRQLCTIFGSELVPRKLSCDVPMEFDNPLDMKVDDYSGELQVTFLETEMYEQPKKRPPPMPISPEFHQKVQKIGEEKEQGELTNIADVCCKLVNKEAGNGYFEIESAIDALQAIPDLDDELLLDRCDLLEDERKGRTFLALDS